MPAIGTTSSADSFVGKGADVATADPVATAAPMFAYLSVDNKEAKALSHVKDAYRCMPAFCVRCVGSERKTVAEQKSCIVTEPQMIVAEHVCRTVIMR